MKKIVVYIAVIIGLGLFLFVGYPIVSQTFLSNPLTETVTDAAAKAAFNTLYQSLENGRYTYFEYINQFPDKQDEAITLWVDHLTKEDFIGYEDQVTFHVEVPTAGLYHMALVYEMAPTVLNNGTVKVLINDQVPFDEAGTIDLPLYWLDDSKDFVLDSYGDEALPSQIKVAGFLETPLYNNLYYTVEPLKFYLEAGTQTITIENVASSTFLLEGLRLYSPKSLLSYEAYLNQWDAFVPSDTVETVNATAYTQKNSSYIRLFSHASPTVTPYDPVDKKLNTIASESWDEPGKALTYNIEVAESGWYHIALHHQSPKEDFVSFRSLAINGAIPFEDVKAYPLKHTKGSDFLYETLSDPDGDPYRFYLEAGSNTLTLRAEYEPLAYWVRTLQLMVDHINQFALDIRKITGREVDKNRTWRITEYLPETQSYLEAYQILTHYVIQESAVYAPNHTQSASLSYIQKALVKLDKMLEDPDKLPLYFEDLYSGSGSVNQMLGDTIMTLTEQPVSLNELSVYTGPLKKVDNAGWWQHIISGLQSFVASFTSDKYVVTYDPEVLNIWMNRPITHVDTLQKMVDAQFTPETGIQVKISVMPDPNKLILAAAAGEAPDIAMGLLSYMPFDLAIRNAAYDLTQFDDFWTVANRFAPGAFVPYVLEDGLYALPETLEFNALVYRKDIFESLGLGVPDTWQDVVELLPELQRYGMNFYHPIAGGGSIKWFYQTSSLIYQNEGTLYSPDGLRSTIDLENSVAGITFLNRLFTMYALPEQEPLFYNAFRYGTLPVGITDFTTYMQIKNAAPELVGQWELANYPGMMGTDGALNRWFIANGRGSIIMSETQKSDEAWTFLKWWTSDTVQTNYGYTLQSIYGPEFLWLSGNLKAVENAPIDMADQLVILEQIQWLRDVPRTPGQYMLERGLSDIWNRVVYDGVPTRIAIDRQVITINREIRRKMIEFGYLDESGQVIKPYYIRDIDWIREQMEKGDE